MTAISNALRASPNPQIAALAQTLAAMPVTHNTGNQAFALAFMNTFSAQTNPVPAQFGQQFYNTWVALHANGAQAAFLAVVEAQLVRNAANVRQNGVSALQRRTGILIDFRRYNVDGRALPQASQAALDAIINGDANWAAASAAAVAAAQQNLIGQGDRNVCYLFLLANILRCQTQNQALNNVTVAQVQTALDFCRIALGLSPTGRLRGAQTRTAIATALNQPWVDQMTSSAHIHTDEWLLTPQRVLRILSMFGPVLIPETLMAAQGATLQTVINAIIQMYQRLPAALVPFDLNFLNQFTCMIDKYLMGRPCFWRVPAQTVERRGRLT